MTLEQKKSYLAKYRLQQMRIRRINEMLIANPEDSQHYKSQLEDARMLRDKIENQIDAVDGGVLSEILSQKYLSGKPLEDVAYGLNYSVRQVQRMHLKALHLLDIES